ncbi:aminotransferase class IV [Flexivirga oryzae]|uniref:Aminotransferase class IV n=1 Tax=Flexivirga oryzae TaxID=1794944 RepID=A0A839NEX3_9MICO|nr:aminotransferase class IV [Flexivirga oryzae]MBB2893695.1 hypothetical protein [Flexivirga oryzae]
MTDSSVEDLARSGPVVLDSWHLYDGAGVAVDRHRARFVAGVLDVFGVPVDEAGAAYDHALGHLPVTGSWFPALVWTREGLRCAVRMFPVERLRTSITLGSAFLDGRKQPDIKGIDYLWQTEQAAVAAAGGYDDRVLVTAGGLVSETIFATLLVLRGRELIAPRAPRLRGVTLSVLRDEAPKAGLTVRDDVVRLSDLGAADGMLTLSALHGVRVVERLGDLVLQPDRGLRDALQAALETARRPVPDGSGACGSC